MIKAVIFDMDGVICDTNPFHSIAFKHFFRKRGLNPNEAEYANHMYGKNNRYIFNYFLDRLISSEELIAFENEKEQGFRDIYKDHIQCIKGWNSFLMYLLNQQVKVGVATSAPRANMDLILDGLNVKSHFNSLMASEDVRQHKPNPEVYLESAKRLEVDPKNCLVFEDSHSGITAAKRAGMQVVAVLSSHEKGELPVSDYYIKEYELSFLKPIIKA